jgi:triphosphoribosyl-dephospho-CoA synthase
VQRFELISLFAKLAMTKSAMLSPGAAATLACIWEVTAPKPGNVHPRASFADVNYAEFIVAAVAIGPIVEQAAKFGVGGTVLEAVRATRDAVGTNTNLGTLLLIVPLAAVPDETPLDEGVADVLSRLTHQDTRDVYEAIRIANAGGLGRAAEADVFADPPETLKLVDAMRLAADRDLVARQYTNTFADVFDGPSAWISEGIDSGLSLSRAIVHAHVRQLAECGDSLIARKSGSKLSDAARQRAAGVLAASSVDEMAYQNAIAELDAWLRADGHRRNPGATADLIAAGLFVLLREGRIDWKRVIWS